MLKGSPSIDSIIEALERIKGHLKMYMGRDDNIDGVFLYLSAFSEACRALGFSGSFDIHQRVLARHGLAGQPRDIVNKMRERGMNDKEIVQELIAMQIEKWQEAKEQPQEPS